MSMISVTVVAPFALLGQFGHKTHWGGGGTMTDVFEGLFGREERTPEESAVDDLRRLKDRNDSAEAAFQRERERRAEYLHMDQRIRNIASLEVNKVVNSLIAMGVGYAAWKEYGVLGIAGIAAAAWAFVWWQRREDRQRPSWNIDGVDELAEDTVIQNQIAEHERDARSWLRVEGKYLHWDGFFDHPFWEDVNKCVRAYAGMSHAKRVADNAAARARSLPYRQAMQARLKEHNLDWDLPHWARLASNEKTLGKV
jgi:hypothetical protein